MKNLSFWLLAAALAAAPASAKRSDVAGQFDSYTFALSWEPAFCAGEPNATECASLRPDRFDASNLVLHGLWPDKDGDKAHAYGYCGVDASERTLDRKSKWCQLPEPEYSVATRDALTTVMPGVTSCLDRHEWAKHGTCSGMTDDNYFAFAATLVRRVAESAFGRYLTANAGRTVDADAMLSAFELDFGTGSGDKLVLKCTNVRGIPALIEAHLHLPNPPSPASELASMLLATREHGNCPSSFLLDPVPSH